MTADLTNPIFTDEETARKHFEAIRWPDGPECPHCGTVCNTRKRFCTGESGRAPNDSGALRAYPRSANGLGEIMSERPRARPLVVPAEGHYVIEEVLEFVDLMPPLEGGEWRIRLR